MTEKIIRYEVSMDRVESKTRARFLVQPDEKIDWFRVIIDLCRKGYTHKTIAVAVGAGGSTTVYGWKQGSTPSFDEGDRLVSLWAYVTENSRDSVPVIKRNSFLA